MFPLLVPLISLGVSIAEKLLGGKSNRDIGGAVGQVGEAGAVLLDVLKLIKRQSSGGAPVTQAELDALRARAKQADDEQDAELARRRQRDKT